MQVIKADGNGNISATVDGIDYEFKIQAYESYSGFAPILIRDLKHSDTYYSPGYMELNGHEFISKFNDIKEGNDRSSRNYYCYTGNVTIYIN